MLLTLMPSNIFASVSVAHLAARQSCFLLSVTFFLLLLTWVRDYSENDFFSAKISRQSQRFVYKKLLLFLHKHHSPLKCERRRATEGHLIQLKSINNLILKGGWFENAISEKSNRSIFFLILFFSWFSLNLNSF